MYKPITQARLRNLFTHKDGVLYWREDRGRLCKVGQRAGSLHSTGYCLIAINGRQYRRAQLIWFWHFGWWAIPQVDHINRIKGAPIGHYLQRVVLGGGRIDYGVCDCYIFTNTGPFQGEELTIAVLRHPVGRLDVGQVCAEILLQ
jgi:hypothetical protein